ncbi:MAG: hypothetical protein IT337_17280 [Thermomicrobiales bacterium]|nr:hypothetical protein [Thermomicrobiales bacterium]
MPRRAAMVALTLLLVWLPALLGSDGGAAAQEPPRQAADLAEIGAGPIGDASLQFVGRAIDDGDTVRLFGYLDGVIGFAPTALFTDPTQPSVTTARFVFAGEIPDATRATQGDATTTTGAGDLTISLLDNGGATWDEPASFAGGAPAAQVAIHLANTLQRPAPQQGVMVGRETLTQATAESFSLSGTTYRFGREETVLRLEVVGALIPGEPGASRAVEFTGWARVTQRGVAPTGVATPFVTAPAATAPEPATPGAVSPAPSGCAALEPWLTDTRQRLTEARQQIATTSVDDPAVLAVATASLAAAVDAQRAEPPPSAATTADRLALTALSTAARGARLAAGALASGDADVLAAGRSALSDGDALIGRALAALDDLAAGCV